MQTDLFGVYVETRLDSWGRHFALHRDCDYLGHHGKSMIAVLIEHAGEMPARATGYKSLDVDLLALEIEQIVSAIASDHVSVACCLRAYYCGSGRRSVERYKTAMALIASVALGRNAVPDAVVYLRSPESLRKRLQDLSGIMLPSLSQYRHAIDSGRERVRNALIQREAA